MTAMGRWQASWRRGVVVAAAAAIGLAAAAQAHADPVDLQVVDRESGQVLKVGRH